MKNETTMKTEIKVGYTLAKFDKTEMAEFVPVSGTWTADFDNDAEDCWDAVPLLESAIEKEVGFPVSVQIFRPNGYAIVDDSNTTNGGSMIVTRK